VLFVSRPSPQTDRVIALMELLRCAVVRDLNASEIARQLGLHRQTCHSMLETLTAAGWLIRHPTRKTYRLGPGMAALGRAADTNSLVMSHSKQPMVALAADLGIAVELIQVIGRTVEVADIVDGNTASKSPLTVGQRFPLQAPVAAVFVAWAPPETFEAWLGSRGSRARASFEASNEAIRSRGFDVRVHNPVLDLAEHLHRTIDITIVDREPGDPLRALVDRLLGHPDSLSKVVGWKAYDLAAISAPITDATGRSPRYALSLSFPLHRPRRGSDILEIGHRLVGATAQIAQAAGIDDSH
jgi:DNA-binding IclR family transcriptional regulator